MHDVSLVMHNHLLSSSLLTPSIKNENKNQYMVLQFNANIKSKLGSKWFKYVGNLDIEISIG